MENIINELWEDMKIKDSKIKTKVFNWLNKDNLNAVILDNDVFWFETTHSNVVFHDYIYDYLIKWGEKKGYTYLYNITPTI